MNLFLYRVLSATTGGEGGEGTDPASETTDKTSGSMEALKKFFTSPVFFIILGVLVALIIAIYFIRRFVKAKHNASIIIVRHGEIYRVVNETNPRYFKVPFTDKVGAVISHEDQVLNSDRLFINNGPDALYKVNYSLTYRVVDPKKFYKYCNNINELLQTKLNDELRLYADEGHALDIVKDYRAKAEKLLEVINKAVEKYSIKVSEFKINSVEPLGRK